MASRDPVLAVQNSLTDRDLYLLSLLYDHGVLTTPQIIHALFTSATYAQKRLLRLVELRVLDRFRPQKAYGGSYPYHYVLDQYGVEVAAAQRQQPLPRPGQAKARRHHLTHRANLHHLAGVNGFFTDLLGHQRTHPYSSLDLWLPASHFQHQGGFFEPGDSPDLMIHSMRVRPDGHGIWTEHDRSVGFFLEYDLGTEPLTVLIDKIARYTTLARYKHRQFVVLLWLPTARRELNLHHRLTELHQVLPFATAAADHAATAGLSPADAVWWLHGHEGPKRRLDDLPSSGYRPDDLASQDADTDSDEPETGR